MRQAAQQGLDAGPAALDLQARQQHRHGRLGRVEREPGLQLAHRLIRPLGFDQQADQGLARGFVARVDSQGRLQAGDGLGDASVLQAGQGAPVGILGALHRRLFPAPLRGRDGLHRRGSGRLRRRQSGRLRRSPGRHGRGRLGHRFRRVGARCLRRRFGRRRRSGQVLARRHRHLEGQDGRGRGRRRGLGRRCCGGSRNRERRRIRLRSEEAPAGKPGRRHECRDAGDDGDPRQRPCAFGRRHRPYVGRQRRRSGLPGACVQVLQHPIDQAHRANIQARPKAAENTAAPPSSQVQMVRRTPIVSRAAVATCLPATSRLPSP